MTSAAKPETSPPVATREEWVHIPTPGDHYSPKTGSAIITMARALTVAHQAMGGKSRVLVAAGTWDGFDDNARTEIPFRVLGTPSRYAKAFDSTVGRLTGRRSASGRAYHDAAAALGSDFAGVVFIYNEPAGVEVLASHCPKAKVCLSVQNELFRTYTPAQARRVVRFAHRILCCSNYIANGIRALAGNSPKIVALLNGVNSDAFKPASPPRPPNVPPRILFVGRMVPEKGPDLLLRAALELQARKVPFQLRLVGSQNFNAADTLTPYEHSIRDLAQQLRPSAEFLPFQPRSEIVKIYQDADIFCVPSNWDEPFGLVVLEGMACALPVVASRRGGIPEAGGDFVKYFSPPDHIALANELESLLRSPTLCGTLGAQARQHAVKLDWSHQYARLIEVLND